MAQPTRPIQRRALLQLAAATLIGQGLPSARAQETYPARPVRIVVPVAAGGAGDIVTRLVAQRLAAQLNQPFVVENRPGAGGATGGAYVAKSAADGYTLSFVSVAFNLMNAMQENLRFNPGEELSPVGLICSQPYLFLARADAPFKTLAEFVGHAKAQPGEVRFAHAGVGTLTHLFGAWLASETGVKLNEIPYGGVAPAINSVLAGQTDVYIGPLSGIPFVKEGRLRAIATTADARLAVLADVPTFKELGLPIRGSTWFGLMAPAGTPKPAIARLNQALNAALQEIEVRQKLSAMHFDVLESTPEQFGRFFHEQTAMWTRLIKVRGIVAPP